MISEFLSLRRSLSLFLLPSVISGAVLLFWQQFGFLAAHLVVEIAGILLAGTAFIVGALLQGFLRTQALSTLATAFGWAAVLSLLHALSYPGMGLLRIDEQSVSAALDLSARSVEAIGFMLAGLHHRRVLPPWAIQVTFGLIASALALISFADWLPALHSEVLVPSSFPFVIRFVILVILARELILIWRGPARPDSELRFGLTLALLFFIGSEVTTLLSTDPFGAPSLIAQSLNLFVYWVIYQIVIKTSLLEPYDRLEHISKVYDAVVDPTLLVDRDALIKKANLAAGRTLGVSPELLIGKSSHVLFHNTEVDPDDCTVCRALKEGRALDRHEITRKHGASLIQISINRIDEPNGAELYVEALHDLSELAQLRRDLSSANAISTQQHAALEALARLLPSKTDSTFDLDLTRWSELLPKAFRAPHLLKVYLHTASFETGSPPPVSADALVAELGNADSSDRLIVYYPESPGPAAADFDPLERALFEMLSSALRARLAR